MNVVDIFPKRIAIIDNVVFSDDVISSFDNLEIANQPTEWNGTYYSKNTYIFHDDFYKEMSSTIMTHVIEYAKSINLSYDEYQFTQCWITYCAPGKYHMEHFHSNSLITGVYYFQDQDVNVSSPLIMHNRNTNFFKNMFGNKIEEDMYLIPYLKNRLVLFPSDINHSVPSNHSKTIRKSLAFNVLPVGCIGNEFGEINFSKLR